ncbi:MAG: PAS domain S-box protein, partial [Candidatus Delongbacteria bacterium]|nr:PAS domain S-box protein [Candidatus Delongbacteria bacterium]
MHDKIPACMKNALLQDDILLIEDVKTFCVDCPLFKKHNNSEVSIMVKRLEFAGKIFGVLNVSLPSHFITDKEEQSLFDEVAGDIAFALNNLDLEDQRQQADQELKESENKYRLIAENSVDFIFQMDLKLKFTYLSPALYNVLGYHPEEAIGMRLFKYTPKKEFLKIARIAIAAMRNYKKNFTTLFETKLLNKKGEEVPVEISGKAVLNEKGRPIGVQGNVRDISERLLTEQALSVSEAQNSAILEAIPDLMFLISREGEFLSYKAASKDLYTDPSQFINKNIFDVLPTQLAERTMKYVQNSLEEGKIQIFEYQLPVDGKQFDWEARMVKMNNDTVLTVIRDITDNKNLEQQLRQVQKMESIGTLVGGIAHDFNNLLTAINGYAELFLMNCEKDHPSYDDIGSILNAGRKAENLTRQLLAFSRKQITEPKIIDINILISDLDKMMRRLVNEDIDMEMNFFKNISFIKADPTQIEQILINLIVNARDAINQCTSLASEKKITVETDQVYLDEAYVAKHVESKTGLHVIISVSDNGIGIDEEIKNKIFEPFFTTKKIGHGTGLGLATVYGIVK